MPCPIKSVVIAFLLTSASGLQAQDLEIPADVQVHYQGYKAERLYKNLSDSLLRAPVKQDGREIRQKVGYAISCQEILTDASTPATYSCSQYFFSWGYTVNPEFIYDIPRSTARKKTYSELKLVGDDAARVFALAAVTFPDDLETCSKQQSCRYQRIVRAPDITCFERKTEKEGEALQYDCAQYIQNLEGFGVPGGGDPMIGVVL
jgi:hypothetical protein